MRELAIERERFGVGRPGDAQSGAGRPGDERPGAGGPAVGGAATAGHTARRAHARPRWAAVTLLAGLLLALAVFASRYPRAWQAELSPGEPPRARAVTLAALGEPVAAAYAMLLYTQTFDSQAGTSVQVARLDLDAIGRWLDRALDLNPDSAYPLLLASRVYAESARPDQARRLLDLVERRFREAPAQRWPWLAHAVYLARHVLGDLPLALRYARSLREHTAAAGAPGWVAQIELLLLADTNQEQAAEVLLGALIDSGKVADPAERAFLLGRLKAAEARASPDERASVGESPRR